MVERSDTADDMPESHKRVAMRWLEWQHGMTPEEASATFTGPAHERSKIGRAKQDAIDVATFIVEECHGR